MISNLFQYLKIYGPKKFTENLIGEVRMLKRGFSKGSFSQNEEDILIDNLLGNKPLGFYVDVGAYDPSRMSNTKRFYLRGWTGINIEPDPKNIKKFYKSRPRDINLNLGIANQNGNLTYFKFVPETLSTFSKKAAESYKKEGLKLVSTYKIKISKLRGILEKYCKGKHIDFLSIDVEGYGYEVLKSNNWKKFKPTIVCFEAGEKFEMDSEKLLMRSGYRKVCKNHNNLIFKLKS
ncbi:MAG: FkbM family methyltransferase [Microgenomates group bacterium Gr01-1014_5]|nr:MAG: FkbM family methyltransferase [Microgenomates group bacterium Gr01-1014_5]